MSECFGKYFIANGKLVESTNFDDSMVKEGKSIYEVIRIINGVPLFLERHLERFNNSAALVNKVMLASDKEIQNSIKDIITKENVSCGNIKIVFNYKLEKDSFYIYFIAHHYPGVELYEEGVHTILYHGERENPNAKVINGDFRSKVEVSIHKNSAFEAILVDRNGFVTEGSKSNIFLIHNETVITSPVEAVLPGVTREVIISILKEANIAFKEENYHFSKIKDLQGLFISGTSPKVLPIKSVDNIMFDSSHNRIINKIRDLYDRMVKEDIDKFKIE